MRASPLRALHGAQGAETTQSCSSVAVAPEMTYQIQRNPGVQSGRRCQLPPAALRATAAAGYSGRRCGWRRRRRCAARRGASRHGAAQRCAALRCAALHCAAPCRAAPRREAQRRAAPRRAALCCAAPHPGIPFQKPLGKKEPVAPGPPGPAHPCWTPKKRPKHLSTNDRNSRAGGLLCFTTHLHSMDSVDADCAAGFAGPAASGRPLPAAKPAAC
eukprot:gene25629-biopygen6018